MAAGRASYPNYRSRFRAPKAMPVRASLWSDVLAALRPAVKATLDCGGESLSVGVDLRHDLAELSRAPFPIGEASADAMAQAFRLQARALLDVALPGRRVAIAAGVLGSIDALEGLISDQLAGVTDVWRKRLGAGD